MIDFILSEIDGSESETIQVMLNRMCKENKINQERQNYKILFSDEKVYLRNNRVHFTSGSSKYLSFYGKIYINTSGKVIETVYSKNGTVGIEPPETSILMVYGGTNNSTVVENDESILHFYIAPSHMLDMQNPENWQSL
jgi:hypothetical protein